MIWNIWVMNMFLLYTESKYNILSSFILILYHWISFFFISRSQKGAIWISLAGSLAHVFLRKVWNFAKPNIFILSRLFASRKKFEQHFRPQKTYFLKVRGIDKIEAPLFFKFYVAGVTKNWNFFLKFHVEYRVMKLTYKKSA